MLSFSSFAYPHQSENKDLEYTETIAEEPLTDFFDQYITPESSSSSENAPEPIDQGVFDFDLGNVAGSRPSHLADKPIPELANPASRLLQRSSHGAYPVTRSSDSLVARRRHRSSRFERLNPAISGLELLNLEGKLPYQARAKHSSSFSNVSTLPLRRKPKFTAETLQGQTHRVSKSVAPANSDSHNTMRPSRDQRHETPSYQEWTRRFEQINIQTPTENLPLSPPPSASMPSRCFVTDQSPQHLQRQGSFDQPQLSPHQFIRPQHSVPSPLESPIGQYHQEASLRIRRRRQTICRRQPGQRQSRKKKALALQLAPKMSSQIGPPRIYFRHPIHSMLIAVLCNPHLLYQKRSLTSPTTA